MRPLFFKDEEPTMNGPVYFERLVASVERIARHAYYPGIDQAIELCLEDIDELMHSSRSLPTSARRSGSSAAGDHAQRRDRCQRRLTLARVGENSRRTALGRQPANVPPRARGSLQPPRPLRSSVPRTRPASAFSSTSARVL